MAFVGGANTQVSFDSNPSNDRSESSLAANPTDPMNLVGASKRFTDPANYIFSLAAYHSGDGGQTWKESAPLVLPGPISNKTIDGLSDPAVAFDNRGNAFLLGLAFHDEPNWEAGLLGMAVYRSTDKGGTWSGPLVIHEGNGDDKQALAADLVAGSPYLGNLYATWDFGGVVFARSSDSGRTWHGVKRNGELQPTGTRILEAEFSCIAVGAHGRVHVFGLSESSIMYTSSSDGGDSFSAPVAVASGITPLEPPALPAPDGFAELPGGVFRVGTYPAACVSGGGDVVVVAWADYRDGVARTYYQRSTDGGATWARPSSGQPLLRGALSSPRDHHDFHPQLATAPDGTIGCTFYEFGPDPKRPLIGVEMATSGDAGATFGDRITVTDKPWDPTVDAPLAHGRPTTTFIGDYFGLAANGLGFFPFWTDTRTGIQEIFTARVVHTHRAALAMAKQTDQTLTALAVGDDGRLHVAWVDGTQPWHAPVAFGNADFRPGAGVAVAKQTDHTFTALAVGNDRRLHVAWVDDTQPWHAPVAFGGADFPAGAAVAMAKQTAHTLTALAVGFDGRLHVAWVDGTQPWHAPVAFGNPQFPAGGAVAMAKQTDHTLTALAVGNDGRLHVAWVNDTQPWNPPVAFGNADFPPGAAVAMAKQTDHTLTAIAVGTDGRLHVAWVNDTQPWNAPVAFGEPVFAPGTAVALANQTDHTLTALAVGLDRRLHVAWVDDTQPWHPPVAFGGNEFPPST